MVHGFLQEAFDLFELAFLVWRFHFAEERGDGEAGGVFEKKVDGPAEEAEADVVGVLDGAVAVAVVLLAHQQEALFVKDREVAASAGV